MEKKNLKNVAVSYENHHPLWFYFFVCLFVFKQGSQHTHFRNSVYTALENPGLK